MSERLAVYPALRLALSPEHRRRAKCDRDVKLHLPEALYDDLVRQARADQSLRERIYPHGVGTVFVWNAWRSAIELVAMPWPGQSSPW